jgi:FAD/FMN-containing dehydrogenase
MVLDHLNAFLKPHGLWFPVDVSTSAQATLGGMAGNNSCGSRSIAYGNMVHNVLGIDAMDCATAPRSSSGIVRRAPAGDDRPAHRSRWCRICSSWARASATRSSGSGRRVMRRVGGYNLDVFHPRSERPYTPDGSVNLAHLLVGSEGTLAPTSGGCT